MSPYRTQDVCVLSSEDENWTGWLGREELIALIRHYRSRHDQLVQNNALLERAIASAHSRIAELEKELKRRE